MSAESGVCHVCGDSVLVDGSQAIERFGDVLCRDCSGEAVVFAAECTNQLCSWTYRHEDTEFNRGHVETRVQQEANTHENTQRAIHDDPTHTTEVWEIDTDHTERGGEP